MVSLLALPVIILAVGLLLVFLALRLLKATRPQRQELMTPDGVPVTVNVAQPGRTRAVVTLILGIAAASISALLIVVIAAFSTEIRTYSDCTANANTTQGEQACRDQFDKAVKEKLGQ